MSTQQTEIELSKAELDEMIERATVDAYNEYEQATGWYTMLEEHLELPFETKLLGVEVRARKLDLRDTEIVVICTRGRERQTISVLDLPLPPDLPEGAQWVEAYRRWRGGS